MKHLLTRPKETKQGKTKTNVSIFFILLGLFLVVLAANEVTKLRKDRPVMRKLNVQSKHGFTESIHSSTQHTGFPPKEGYVQTKDETHVTQSRSRRESIWSRKKYRSCMELEDVPLDVHRRAAQLLEDVRGTASAPTWDDASFAPACVRVLHRPDVVGPAYYEFRVSVDHKASGFIIVSTGEHDYPVTHWNYKGPSPTDQLIEMGGEEDDTYFKLDTFCYVAEADGVHISAIVGELPPRIINQKQAKVEDTTVTWATNISGVDDEKASSEESERTSTGPELGSFSYEDWESWTTLKNEYADVYHVMLDDLKEQVRDEWETEMESLDPGEGLVLHQIFELALLYTCATIEASGKGADMVSIDQVKSATGREILQITVHTVPTGGESPVKLNIKYPNKTEEEIRFVVVDQGDVNATHIMAENKNAYSVHARQSAQFGPWHEFWAGDHWDQRFYSQISSGVRPNTKECSSGCAATAWAMLFGWGDYMASQSNSGWNHRWGLYRKDGGYGNDTVAPKYMTPGVRKMIWEIHKYIDTFCIFSAGATFPWDMDKAAEYLKGRSGTRLVTHYNVIGLHSGDLHEAARDSIIKRGVPAIIGTGWLEHYPLAYGYCWRSRRVKKCILIACWHETEYQRQFYVNQGWSGSGNGWIGSGTWFAGLIYPD